MGEGKRRKQRLWDSVTGNRLPGGPALEPFIQKEKADVAKSDPKAELWGGPRIEWGEDFPSTFFVHYEKKPSTQAVPKPAKPPAPPKSDPNAVSWDSIGGLEDVKAEIRAAVEIPLQNAELYAAYGQRPVKGILLSGPPGCGKTMIGKAIATSTAKYAPAMRAAPGVEGGRNMFSYYGLTGEAPESNKPPTSFVYVSAPSIQDKYVGESEKKIRKFFSDARDFFKQTGRRQVLFIDECDSILAQRGSGYWMSEHLVPQFLTEMDGIDDGGGPFIVLATNRPEILDDAIVRPGRIDRRIEVRRPNRDEAREIFRLNLVKRPCIEDLAELAAERLMAGRGAQVVSGALIATIVDAATGLAIRRDIANGAKKPQGIGSEELLAAIDYIVAQQKTEQRVPAPRMAYLGGGAEFGRFTHVE